MSERAHWNDEGFPEKELEERTRDGAPIMEDPTELGEGEKMDLTIGSREEEIRRRSEELNATNLRLKKEIESEEKIQNAINWIKKGFEELLWSLTEGTIVIDASNFNIVEVDETAQELLEFAEEDIKGKTFTQLVGDRVDIMKQIDRHTNREAFEARIKKSDGSDLRVLQKIYSMYIEYKKHYIIKIYDISVLG